MIIKSQRVKKAVLAALADEEMVKILDSTRDQGKSVRHIIAEKSIPYANAYRKAKWLLAERLVVIDKIIITPDGKKFSLFRSVLSSINVKYEGNEIIVEAEQNFSPTIKTMERFFSLE
jgi:DNA-binding transcriptional ArsR family regulator